jgi:hypothetical protein
VKAARFAEDHPWLGAQLATGEVQPSYRCHVMGSSPSPVAPELLGLAGLIPGSPPPEMPKSVSFSMAMHAFTSTDGTPCADLEAAENLALDFIRAKSTVMPNRADVFELQRAGSAIANVTRRGR